MTALLPIAVALLGALLIRRAGRRPLPATTVVLAAPGVGLAAAALAFFGWRLVGGASGTFLPVFAIGTLAAVALAWRRPSAAPAPSPSRGELGVTWQVGVALLGAAVMLALRSFQLHRFDAPIGQFDARAIWNAHALLLWRAEEPLAGIFQGLKHGHPSYPLFLPAGLAAQFALLGGDNILTPAVQSLLLTLAAAATIWIGLHLLGAGRWGPLAAALFLVTPAAQLWGFSQCADIPIAYLFGAAGIGLAVQLGATRRAVFPAWLSGLFVGLLPWTKNEGLLLAVILLASWGVIRWTLDRARRPPPAPLLVGTLPGILSLVAFKLLWSPKDEIVMFASGAVGRVLDPERWSIVPAAFWREFNPWTGSADWGLSWALVVVLCLLGGRAFTGRPAVRFLGLALALSYLTWFGVYLGTLHDPVWHLETSLDRLLLHLLPLTLVATFLAVEDGWLASSLHRRER